MRMRKLLMLITSVWVKIQLNSQECPGNSKHGTIKNHNVGICAYANF